MSEKIPQSNPEKMHLKKYIAPIHGNGYVYGIVNEDRQSITVSRQRNGGVADVKSVEFIYETVDENNQPVIESKMISDHVLSDEMQQQYLEAMNKNKGE